MAAQIPGTNHFQTLIESICRANDRGEPIQTEDLRQIFTQIGMNLKAALPGGQFVAPGGTKASGGATPAGMTFAVTGANGAFNVSIGNPTNAQGKTVWIEVSYCALRSFTQNVTTMPLTTATSLAVNAPGQSQFFRMRASFDQVNWSGYQLAASSAVASGLVSSTATSNAGAFNQTNYGFVTSTAVGGSAEVQVHGASGAYTSMVAQKGPQQRTLPGATIIGVTPGTDQFVGFDGSKYVLRSTLAALLSDDSITPIGKVSVVETGSPVLPTLALVLGAGGAVIGWNVLTQGNGLTAPVTLTITTATGSGATPGAQTIQNGKLISVAPGNPGQLYDPADTVAASGGVGGGVTGGGTAAGGNGGRLTDV